MVAQRPTGRRGRRPNPVDAEPARRGLVDRGARGSLETPAALITVTGRAVGEALVALVDSGNDDGPKLGVVATLLASCRLLVGVRRFRAEPVPGRESVPGPGDRRGDELSTMSSLTDAANTGALLVTSRYPLPSVSASRQNQA
jgi:hypothetical protein